MFHVAGQKIENSGKIRVLCTAPVILSLRLNKARLSLDGRYLS